MNYLGFWLDSLIKKNTGFTVEECNSDKTDVDQKVTDGSRVVKSLSCNNFKQIGFCSSED